MSKRLTNTERWALMELFNQEIYGSKREIDYKDLAQAAHKLGFVTIAMQLLQKHQQEESK